MNIDKSVITRKYEVQIKAYKDLIPCIQRIIPVLTKFDGKVINVKLDRALKEVAVDCYYYIGNSHDETLYIEIQLKERSYQLNEIVCSYDFTSCVSLYDIPLLNNRLDATTTIAKVNSWVESLNETIAKLETNFASLDKTIEAYRQLYKQIQEYKKCLDEVTRKPLEMRCL